MSIPTVIVSAQRWDWRISCALPGKSAFPPAPTCHHATCHSCPALKLCNTPSTARTLTWSSPWMPGSSVVLARCTKSIKHSLTTRASSTSIIISAATAELLVLFKQQARLPLDRDAAMCLLTGIITDTSSFQFTNTTPRCLEVAALLLRAGAIPEHIIQPLYRALPLAQARFQAMIIANAQTACEGRLIWSQATEATLEAAGAIPEMDDGISTRLHDIEGVQIAAFLKSYYEPTVTRLSLRASAPYNAAEICQRISNGLGGGHARAAGATFHMPIEEATMLVIGELEKEIRSV